MNRDYLWDQLAPFKSECKGRAAAVSSAVLECRGEQGGVVREAESVKYLVEAQSPSLATDPCLLSEGQSWASQLPFSPPPKKKQGEGVEGRSPHPLQFSPLPFMQIGSWHLQQPASFLLYIFIPSLFFGSFFLLKAPFGWQSLVAADMRSFIYNSHLCKGSMFAVCSYRHKYAENLKSLGGRPNLFVWFSVPVYEGKSLLLLQVSGCIVHSQQIGILWNDKKLLEAANIDKKKAVIRQLGPPPTSCFWTNYDSLAIEVRLKRLWNGFATAHILG